MDLRTHLGVIWRFRVIVVLGLVLAVGLAFLSVFRVSFANGASVSYRDKQTWLSSETLLLGQYVNPDPNNNFTGLTSLYVSIANSATIRTRVLPGGRPTKTSGDYSAYQVLDQNGQPQPIMTFSGTGNSPLLAASVARRASFQFRSYLTSQSTSAHIPITILTPASVRDADIAKGRKYTTPILIMIAVLLATLGLAYLLENLRPRKTTGQSRGARKQSGTTEARATPLRERKAASLAARAETTRQVETTGRQ